MNELTNGDQWPLIKYIMLCVCVCLRARSVQCWICVHELGYDIKCVCNVAWGENFSSVCVRARFVPYMEREQHKWFRQLPTAQITSDRRPPLSCLDPLSLAHSFLRGMCVACPNYSLLDLPAWKPTAVTDFTTCSACKTHISPLPSDISHSLSHVSIALSTFE